MQVLNLPPIVDAGPDQSVDEGSTVTFNGTATDPAGDADPLTFAWDLNYDGFNFNSDLTGPTVSAFYGDGPQSYVVALRVDDGDGGQTIDTTNLNINNRAPEILAVTTSDPKEEGGTISVQVSATDVGSDTLTYAFDWENDGDFDVVNETGSASNVWPNDGAYTVGLFVEDGDDGQAFSTVDFSVANLPPLAVVTGPSGAVLEGSAASFSAAGTTDPGVLDVLTYRWNFGDGSSATGPQTSHAYADNGVYSTTLTVTDDAGASSVASVSVAIDNANPTISPNPNIIVDEGDNVTIDFSATATDPGTADTLTYEWDFNGDGLFDDGLGPNPAKSFQLDGPKTFNVAIRVRDDDYPANRGEPGQVIGSTQVIVNNRPPTNVKANVPATGQEGQNIPLIADTALDVISDTLTYEWDINQDGSYDLSGQTTNYTWNTAGNYEVKLRVRDEDGGEGFDTAQITIQNGPPVANAGGTYSGDEGSPIALNGTATDPSVPADTLAYTWDLNSNKTFGEAGEIGQNVTVTYPDDRPTPYTVTLQVDDGRGGVDTDVAQINVANVPPTINNASASPAGPYTENNTSIIFNGAATDPGADSLTYVWNFQDGTPNVTNNVTPPHNFIDNGTFNVTLTVSDGDGGVTVQTVPIVVQNLDPTAVITITSPPYREGVPVVLGSGNSTDPSPADPLSYRWQVSDGAITQTITNTTNTTITYAFPDNGVYTVTLRADDGDGGLDTDMITVTVQNVAPTANAGGPYNTTISSTINLNATGTDVPGDLPLTYTWDLDNDNNFGEAGETGQTVPFSRTITGTFTVTVRVADGDGGTATDTTTVTVNSVLPLAFLQIGYLWFRQKRRKKRLCQRE
jgi:PKD repeat protein